MKFKVRPCSLAPGFRIMTSEFDWDTSRTTKQQQTDPNKFETTKYFVISIYKIGLLFYASIASVFFIHVRDKN